MDTYGIGIIGLGVMGLNLARNFSGHGTGAAGFDINPAARASAGGDPAIGIAASPVALAGMLSRPRSFLLTVPAGPAVDSIVAELCGALEPGDLIIDGGNSSYRDTARRILALEERGVLFCGCGISGGELGALRGPCFMPGGPAAARERVVPLLEPAAARLPDGTPACAWIGPEGSGHFAKMVHNGIEYSMMQAIAETYDIMHRGMELDPGACARLFERWRGGPLEGYLLDITIEVLSRMEGRFYLVDMIRDRAAHKGTGMEATAAAHDLGIPVPMLKASLAARMTSRRIRDRDGVRRAFGGAPRTVPAAEGDIARDLENALICSHAVAVSEGFSMLSAASRRFNWLMDFAGIARIWQAGCIIQSKMMKLASDAMLVFPEDFTGSQIFALEPLAGTVRDRIDSWRRITALAVRTGIPAPAHAASLFHLDSLRADRLPASLTQGQRDLFGAHGFERLDAEIGKLFHHDWKKEGNK